MLRAVLDLGGGEGEVHQILPQATGQGFSQQSQHLLRLVLCHEAQSLGEFRDDLSLFVYIASPDVGDAGLIRPETAAEFSNSFFVHGSLLFCARLRVVVNISPPGGGLFRIPDFPPKINPCSRRIRGSCIYFFRTGAEAPLASPGGGWALPRQCIHGCVGEMLLCHSFKKISSTGTRTSGFTGGSSRTSRSLAWVAPREK